MDVLKNIFTLAKAIHGRVKTVKNNRQWCEYLQNRIDVITNGLEMLKDEQPDFEEKMQKGLISLEETLRSALDLVEECDATGAVTMFLKANSFKDRFEEVNRRLSRNQQDLTLAGHVAQASDIRKVMDEAMERMVANFAATLQQLQKSDEHFNQQNKKQFEAMRAQFVKQQQAIEKHEDELKQMVQRQQNSPTTKQEPQESHPAKLRSWEISWDELEFQKDEITGKRRVLGEGGFAIVYHAKWRGKDAAVKVFKSNDGVTGLLESFIAEVSACNKIRHPNILKFHGATMRNLRDRLNRKGEQYSIVTDVAGMSLVDAYQQNKYEGFYQCGDRSGEKLSTKDKLTILLKIAKALLYLHDCDPPIVHRDIKCENVLLRDEIDSKEPLLIDFGLADVRTSTIRNVSKLAGAERNAGAPIGYTELYAPPEVLAAGGRGIKGHPSQDIYSLGCLMYEFMVEQPPFWGQDTIFDPQKMVVGNTELHEHFHHSTIEAASPVLQQLIIECVAHDPSMRPDTTTVVCELANALSPKPVLRHIPTVPKAPPPARSSRPTTGVHGSPSKAPSPPTRESTNTHSRDMGESTKSSSPPSSVEEENKLLEQFPVPPYWSKNTSLPSPFKIEITDETELKKFHDLVGRCTDTSRLCMGADLGNEYGPHKTGYTWDAITPHRVWRVENRGRWDLYSLKRDSFVQKMDQSIDYDVQSTKESWMTPLDREHGEMYLFHGTKHFLIDTLCTNGFNPKFGTVKGMFGAGTYFAEDCAKADQYCHPDDDDFYYMFLARVTMGKIWKHPVGKNLVGALQAPGPATVEGRKFGATETHDSVLAKANPSSFREFVVFDGDVAYPEFIIQYRRNPVEPKKSNPPPPPPKLPAHCSRERTKQDVHDAENSGLVDSVSSFKDDVRLRWFRHSPQLGFEDAIHALFKLRAPPNRRDLEFLEPDDDDASALVRYIQVRLLPSVKERDSVKKAINEFGLTTDELMALIALKIDIPYPVRKWVNGLLLNTPPTPDSDASNAIGPYFSLIYRALEKLPKVTPAGRATARALPVKDNPALEDVFNNYTEELPSGKDITLWNFTSFSTDEHLVNSRAFVGAKDEDAIIYTSPKLRGVDMQPFAPPNTEDAADILPVVPTTFQVVVVTKAYNKLNVILQHKTDD